MTRAFRGLMGSFFGIMSVVAILYIYLMPMPWGGEGFIDAGRCGPGAGVCPDALRCINGYCKSDNPPTLPPLSDLPVHPDRY